MNGQIEYTLRLRLWDLNPNTDPDWHECELERIAGMVADGFTSGEIIGDHEETGWWELERSEMTTAPDMLAELRKAESFISGFEGDELQDGIADLLAGIRAAIAKAEGRA